MHKLYSSKSDEEIRGGRDPASTSARPCRELPEIYLTGFVDSLRDILTAVNLNLVRHNNATLPPVTFTGASVSSVSRSGSKPDKWAAGQSWVDKVSWTKGDPTTGDISPAFSGASAVVSCVGVIGGSDEEMEKGNGDVNVAAASQVQLLLHFPALAQSLKIVMLEF